MRWLGLLVVASACGGEVVATDGAGGAGLGGGGAGGSGGGATPVTTCHDAPPPGAPEPPAAPAYSDGSCPVLVPGTNQLTSNGVSRELILVVPEEGSSEEPLPVVFLWHWLGGDADDFVALGDLQAATNALRFVAVVPEAKGDLQFTWPMDVASSQARVDEELRFFDDMLACVSEQLNVNLGCVSSAGVSAGALFTSAVLAGARGEHLSSFVSLSGGVGGYIKPWTPSPRRMPALVLWGGPTDDCFGVVNFEETSQTLEQALDENGHFYLECIHNCGHAAPPFEGMGTPLSPVWRFIFDHPFWQPEGTSAYEAAFPPEIPTWCGIKAGSATMRQGECTAPSGC